MGPHVITTRSSILREFNSHCSAADDDRMWRSSLLAIGLGLALRATGVYDAYGWKWTWLLLIVTGVVTLPWALWRERRLR